MKTITRIFTFILLSVFLQTAVAQSVDEIFSSRPEVVFSFEVTDMSQLNKLNHIFTIDEVEGNTAIAYANRAQFETFLTYGIEYNVLTAPSLLTDVKMMSSLDGKAPLEWTAYPTYDQYVEIMEQFSTAHPELCELVNFGTSVDGRALLACKISANVGTPEFEPKFFYTGTMHGDETTGYIMLLDYIEYLLINYGASTPEGIAVTALLDDCEVWINPLANPDGTFHGGNNTVNGSTRYNANSIDLNRNYPDPKDGPHPDGNAWQPETIAFMALAEEEHFTMSMNLHGGAEVLNYPWDTWSRLHPDDQWLIDVSREFATNAQTNSPSGYLTYLNNGITNGYQWYTTTGSRQDYMNFFQQCREITGEISNTKLLPESQLDDHWDYLKQAFFDFNDQSRNGVRGIITNCVDGLPVEGAMVYVDGRDTDMDSSMVFSHELGDYYRLLNAGTYTITYSAPGFAPEERTVVVVDGESVLQNVELCCGDLEADFMASETAVNIGTTISFTDLSSGCPNSWSWEFEGGTPATSNEQNPVVTYSEIGVYNVSLLVTVGGDENQTVKQDYIVVSEEYIMEDATFVTCSGIFYDNGGADANYSDSKDFTTTFLPGDDDAKIIADFISFNVEDNASCAYDYLKIYDGETASATLIGTYCGTDSPGVIEATNASGALTFVFHSDSSVNEEGWVALISCTTLPVPPTADFYGSPLEIAANGEVQFTDLSSNATSWSWEFVGGIPATSTEQNPLVTYESIGNYDVTLTVYNDFGDNSVTKSNYVVVSDVSTISLAEGEFNLYPNPVSKGEMVKLQAKSKINHVNVIDYQGRRVMQLDVDSESVEFSSQTLSSGVYFIQIQSGTLISTTKLIVE